MRELVRGLVWLAVVAGAIGALLYLFVLDAWRVPAGDLALAASVQPTLAAADLVLVRRQGRPVHGELARCLSPRDGSYVIGRVFGEPGDRVEVTDERVTTGGRSLAARHGCPPVLIPHPVTQNLVKMGCSVADTGAWTFSYLHSADGLSVGHWLTDVEPGKLYLVSDNRLMHQDSRDFGQVDAESCHHVVYRLWGEKYEDGARRFTLLW